MPEPNVERDPTLERLEDFSNSVFAIAITLLVFELVVPHLTGTVSATRPWRALGDDWPRLFSYVLSFVLVGQIWINYQRMLSHIDRSDHWLLWLNLLLLLMVAGYAFPTSLLGEDALKPGAQTVAALIYGSWLSISGACFPAIWWRAVSKGLVTADLESQHVHRLGRFWSLGIAVTLVVTLIALLNVWISFAGFFCLAVFYILPPPRVARAGDPASEGGQRWWVARLLGAANALMAASGVRRLPSMHALAHRKLAARQAPGSEAVETVETVQAEGAALSEEQPIAEALEETTPGERGGAHD